MKAHLHDQHLFRYSNNNACLYQPLIKSYSYTGLLLGDYIVHILVCRMLCLIVYNYE